MKRIRNIVVHFIFLAGVCFRFANAQVYPADFAQVLVANGISNPTVMEFAPDGRIFVAQQGGSLRVINRQFTTGSAALLQMVTLCFRTVK